MLGQAYLLKWLESEVERLQIEYSEHIPLLDLEDERKQNLTAINNQIQIQIDKLAVDYFERQRAVKKLNETRNEIFPKISESE